MLQHQLADALVHLLPQFVGSHRPQRHPGHFHGQIKRALVADVDDHRLRASASRQELRYLFDRFLRR